MRYRGKVGESKFTGGTRGLRYRETGRQGMGEQGEKVQNRPAAS